MNTYLKYQSPAIQFFAFLAFAGGFFLLNALLTFLFFHDINELLANPTVVISQEAITKFKVVQIISAIISFLFPALLFGYYSSPKALPYIGIQKTISPIVLIPAIVLLFVIQPFIGYIGNLNEHINFGEFQKNMLKMEAMYDRIMKVFLQMHSFGDLLFNLFIMALLPAVSEELFFRGAFQKALLRLSNRPWIAIFISSTVFALLHGTLLKVIPIFTLGLLLGTIYHVTRNIWYTIIIHFINNCLALLAYYYGDRSEFLKKLSDDNIQVPVYMAIVSVAISVGLIYFIAKKGEEVLPKTMTDEDNDFIA